MTDHPKLPALTPEGERAFAYAERGGPLTVAEMIRHSADLHAEIRALHAVLLAMEDGPVYSPQAVGYGCTWCGGKRYNHRDITNGYGCPAEFIERLRAAEGRECNT